MSKTTQIGYVSPQGNEVIAATRLASKTMKGQRIYQLRCAQGHDFGANGADIHIRLCPACHARAARGEPLV